MIPAVRTEKPRVSRAFRGIMETAGIEPAPCSRRALAAEDCEVQGNRGGTATTARPCHRRDCFDAR